MKILKVNNRNFKTVFKIVIKLIKEGKVIVCPTDTVYGLICDATNKKAVRKLFNIKKRPTRKPTPIFVKSLKMAKKFAKINKEQEKFLKKVWPGKATVVLRRKKAKMKLYGVDKKTIALRIPKYVLINILLQELNLPLIGTSANISGKPASNNIKEIINQFTPFRDKSLTGFKNQPPTIFGGGQPDFVIDAGNLKKSKPSTVIDLTSPKIKILRRGWLKQKQLLKLCQKSLPRVTKKQSRF